MSVRRWFFGNDAGTFKFRISKAGFDAKTGADADMLVASGQSLAQIVFFQTIEITAASMGWTLPVRASHARLYVWNLNCVRTGGSGIIPGPRFSFSLAGASLSLLMTGETVDNVNFTTSYDFVNIHRYVNVLILKV
jgi:hypothetical protein